MNLLEMEEIAVTHSFTLVTFFVLSLMHVIHRRENWCSPFLSFCCMIRRMNIRFALMDNVHQWQRKKWLVWVSEWLLFLLSLLNWTKLWFVMIIWLFCFCNFWLNICKRIKWWIEDFTMIAEESKIIELILKIKFEDLVF